MGNLGELFSIASLAVVTQYGLGGCALAILAARRTHGLTRGDAWPALPTLVVTAFLLGGATAKEWAVAGGAVLLGWGVRAARARSCPRRGAAR